MDLLFQVLQPYAVIVLISLPDDWQCAYLSEQLYVSILRMMLASKLSRLTLQKF